MTAYPDPQDVIAALTAAGFTVVASAAGLYTRLHWPQTHDGRARSVLVPLDGTFADYADRMDEILSELRHVAEIGRTAQTVLDALTTTP